MNQPFSTEWLLSIASPAPPTSAALEQKLGAPLRKDDRESEWQFFQFDPAEPFVRGEYRYHGTQSKALLVLEFPEQTRLTLNDVDLAPLGKLRSIDANPRIPPEGADGYIYETNGVLISVQFTHLTRRLRLVALEWRGTAEG